MLCWNAVFVICLACIFVKILRNDLENPVSLMLRVLVELRYILPENRDEIYRPHWTWYILKSNVSGISYKTIYLRLLEIILFHIEQLR